jgi:cation:H+ antiporter
MPPWLVFLLSSAAVILAGARLSRDGTSIANRTGLGGAWVGAVLVAGVTSLPELTTDTFAVLQGTPSLAVGNLFGSAMANMLVLAVADLATHQGLVLTRVSINQSLIATLAITLTATAAAGMLASGTTTVAWIGWAPLAIALGYAAGMRALYRNRAEPPFETVDEAAAAAQRAPSLQLALTGFVLATLVTVVAARFLASSTADVAAQLGLSAGLAGVALLALTTSLPDLVVSVTSVRAGAYDLAVGNLLGSNCFNIAILVALDVADGPGPLLASIEPSVLLAALFALLMMAQALLEILNRAERRVWYLQPGTLLLIVTYAVGLYLIAQASPFH